MTVTDDGGNFREREQNCYFDGFEENWNNSSFFKLIN